MKQALLLCLLLLIAAPVRAQETPAANPDDVASVDAILAAVYDVISGPAGAARDWDRFKALFAPGARLIPIGPGADGGAGMRALSPEEYIGFVDGYFRQNPFYEVEVHRVAEAYGHMVHAFSTYESRRDPADAAPFARGINSIQLFHDGSRWWIVTIYWDAEHPGQPIPARYLPE